MGKLNQADESPSVQYEIEELLRSLFAAEEDYIYVMKAIAGSLEGLNKNEYFYIFKGATGRNGKGVLTEFVNRALGEGRVSSTQAYYLTPSATILTSERPSPSKPNVDVLFFKGKRFVSMSEPQGTQKINAEFIKHMTGSDTITGHMKHSNEEVRFKPQHTMFISCNDLPKMNCRDEALWTRAKVIDFPFKFVEKPTETHHRKIDTKWKDVIATDPRYGINFMLLLLFKYYPLYKQEGLKDTERMRVMHQNTKLENDHYLQFVRETFLEADGQIVANRIKKLEIMSSGEKFFRANFPDIKFSPKEAQRSMTEIFGHPSCMRGVSDGTEWNCVAYKGIKYKGQPID